MKKRSIYSSLKLILLLLSLLFSQSAFTPVHSGNRLGRVGWKYQTYAWSFIKQIPGLDNDSPTPFLVADRNRAIHAFTSKQVGRDLAIVYSQWTQELDWSMPVDILLSPRQNIARIMGAYLDDRDVVHVIFFGGNELNAGIYHSSAPVSEAGRAPAWSPLQLVGEDAGPVSHAALTVDSLGNLFVVYSGKVDGNGLYSVMSTDRGASWTAPATVWVTRDEVLWPINMEMTLDHQNQLHLVWTAVNVRGVGTAVFYSRLAADHKQWSTPVALAEKNEGDYSANWGSIIEYQDQLILMYMDSSPATRWMRRSLDGGETWTEPIRPFDYVGEYGAAMMVVDSSNTLHLILGFRQGSTPDLHGMWHSTWLGDRWSELAAIVSGPRVVSEIGGSGFDPTLPQVVVSQGNLLMVAWITDSGAGLNGAWYSYTNLGTPELPEASAVVQPTLPTATPAVIPVTGPIAPEATQPDTSIAQLEESAPRGAITSPSATLTAAMVPALLLIFGVIFLYRKRFSSR